MHTTALCSPTRSCILTGRNHHSNGVACIMELATGYPGYDGRMPFENGMLPEMLLPAGLQHVLPRQVAPVAVGGEHAGRAVPPLAARARLRALLRLPRRRDQPVVSGPDARQRRRSTQPKTPEEGYHLSEDLADQAIKLILDAHVNAPEKPFFMYYAPGCRARAAPRARRSGPTATRASSTPAGTPTARRSSRASRRSGSSPATPSSRRATRTSRSGRRCPPTSGGCTRA